MSSPPTDRRKEEFPFCFLRFSTASCCPPVGSNLRFPTSLPSPASRAAFTHTSLAFPVALLLSARAASPVSRISCSLLCLFSESPFRNYLILLLYFPIFSNIYFLIRCKKSPFTFHEKNLFLGLPSVLTSRDSTNWVSKNSPFKSTLSTAKTKSRFLSFKWNTKASLSQSYRKKNRSHFSNSLNLPQKIVAKNEWHENSRKPRKKST